MNCSRALRFSVVEAAPSAIDVTYCRARKGRRVTEPPERSPLNRLYAVGQSGRLLPAVSDIYPDQLEAWCYLGSVDTCTRGTPRISYRPFRREGTGLAARIVEVDWNETAPPEPTALYHLYDSSGGLLYIGITTNPTARFTQHALYKKWWPSVARVRLSWLSVTRNAALLIETAAIQDEEPLHNGKHNGRAAPFPPSSWPPIEAAPRQKSSELAARLRVEVQQGRWRAGMRVPEAAVVAAASKVSIGTANRAYEALKKEGLLVAHIGHGTFVTGRPQRSGAPPAAPLGGEAVPDRAA